MPFFPRSEQSDTVFLVCCTSWIFFFHIISSAIHESMFRREGFTFGWVVTLFQFATYAGLSRIQSWVEARGEAVRAAVVSALSLPQNGGGDKAKGGGVDGGGPITTSPSLSSLTSQGGGGGGGEEGEEEEDDGGKGRDNMPREGGMVRFVSPGTALLLLPLMAVGNMGLANVALEYVDYPTKVLFKSCKLLLFMVGGVVVLGKQFTPLQYGACLCMMVGLTCFGSGNIDSVGHINITGVWVLCGSLGAEAILGNLQEYAMQRRRMSVMDTMWALYGVGTPIVLVVVLLSGTGPPFIAYCGDHPSALAHTIVFCTFSYGGMACLFLLIRRFSALTGVTCTSLRKMTTVVLSYVIFPKPFSAKHGAGMFLIFLGVFLSVYAKDTKKVKRALSRLVGGGGGDRGGGRAVHVL